MKIPEHSIEKWIEVLEPYQKELMNELLNDRTEEEVLQIWIEAYGPANTAVFGGEGKKSYLKEFKHEFDKVILGDEKYNDLIQKINEHVTISNYLLVSYISIALSDVLGVATGVIAPLTVLCLGMIGRMGLNAYKNTIEK